MLFEGAHTTKFALDKELTLYFEELQQKKKEAGGKTLALERSVSELPAAADRN